MRRLPLLLALFVTVSACLGATSVDDSVTQVRDRIVSRTGMNAVSDRLFCGMSIANGGVVTDAQVETFLSEVVEPRFPDGFTVWRARGRWRGGSEETLVLEIVHLDDPRYDAAVREIGEEYRRRFLQQSVLRVQTPARMDFIEEPR